MSDNVPSPLAQSEESPNPLGRAALADHAQHEVAIMPELLLDVNSTPGLIA